MYWMKKIDPLIKKKINHHHHLKTQLTSINLKHQCSSLGIALLTLPWRRPLSYRNQSINLQSKLTDWFLYDNGLRHERVNKVDGYLLESSLKHQYLVKIRPFSTAKTIGIYDYIKPTQRYLKQEIFVLHVGTNDLPLKIISATKQ